MMERSIALSKEIQNVVMTNSFYKNEVSDNQPIKKVGFKQNFFFNFM